MKFYKYPKVQAGAALMLGLTLIVLFIDYVLGFAMTQGVALASIPFLAFHRSPDDGWEAGATFETPEKAIEALSSKGFTTRTKDQETEYLKNATEKAVGDAIKSNDRKFLDGWDSKVKEITGVSRDPSIKTEDYIFNQLSGALKGKTDTQKLYDDLKAKGMTDSDATKELQKQFDAFKVSSKTEQEKLTGEISGYKQGMFTNKLDSQISSAMQRIKPLLTQGKTDIEKLMLENTIENMVNNFKLSFKAIPHNEEIIFHNAKDDTAVINPTDGNHLSAFTILSQLFEPLVDKDRKQGGTGGAGGEGEGAGGEGDVQIPNEVKTRVDLYSWLETGYKDKDGKNIEPGSREFNDLYEKLKIKL